MTEKICALHAYIHSYLYTYIVFYLSTDIINTLLKFTPAMVFNVYRVKRPSELGGTSKPSIKAFGIVKSANGFGFSIGMKVYIQELT